MKKIASWFRYRQTAPLSVGADLYGFAGDASNDFLVYDPRGAGMQNRRNAPGPSHALNDYVKQFISLPLTLGDPIVQNFTQPLVPGTGGMTAATSHGSYGTPTEGSYSQ